MSADLDALAALRAAHPTTPIALVSLARAQIPAALDGGADIAMAGAIRTIELRARLRALERRREQAVAHDAVAGSVTLDGVTYTLPPRELALLRLLAGPPGCVRTKHELIEACWGAHEPRPGPRTLERRMARLRRRLGRHGALLVTVWGVGYRLDARH